jgi:hypothetical protein
VYRLFRLNRLSLESEPMDNITHIIKDCFLMRNRSSFIFEIEKIVYIIAIDD